MTYATRARRDQRGEHADHDERDGQRRYLSDPPNIGGPTRNPL
ncbi:MAG TPA: hypothetical protein VJ870_04120 [Amycolatopsis sp.]|nr:hypothetical protein [Amycolatopsis sp.]